MSIAYSPAPTPGMLHNVPRRMDGQKRKRPDNTGSNLLNQRENELLFSCLPFDNYSLCAAVVEVLEGKPDDKRWIRLHRGVLSLVKDYSNRAYLLRMFDIQNCRPLWDMKMYRNFTVIAYPSTPNFLSCESEEGRIFGLNFASPQEAAAFKGHVDKRNEQERKNNQQRNNGGAVGPVALSTAGSGRPPAAPASFNANGVTAPSAAPLLTTQPEKESGFGFFGMRTKKKKDKRRIRKEDISNPTNFQHKAHVGWDQDNGFTTTQAVEEMDASVAEIIRAAGMDPAAMEKKTIKFVYDFIDNYQRENPAAVASIANFAPPASPQVKNSQAPFAPLNNWGSPAVAPPQPVVAHNNNVYTPNPPPRGASVYHGSGSHYATSAPPARPPPPPPAQGPRVQKPLPMVPSLPGGSRPDAMPPPPPPLPPVMSGTAPPPPPPPPPPPMETPRSGAAPPPPPPPPPNGGAPSDLKGLPAAQPSRGNLLAEIQAGKQLRSVGQAAPSPVRSANTDTRGNVMEQIRQGTTLKHVDVAAEEKRRSTQGANIEDIGGIAGALARALAERRGRLDSDSDSEDSDENNEWSDS